MISSVDEADNNSYGFSYNLTHHIDYNWYKPWCTSTNRAKTIYIYSIYIKSLAKDIAQLT